MADNARRRLLGAARGSIRVRITSAVVAVLGVALVLGAVALVSSLHAMLTREVRAEATLRAFEVARVVQAGGDPVAAVAGHDNVVMQVLAPAGSVVAASPNMAGRPPLALPAPGASGVTALPFDDDAFVVVAASAGNRTVLLGQSLGAVGDSTRALATLLTIGLPVLLLVVGATAWRTVGRALAPVDSIRAEVDEISATELHRRVAPSAAADEIGRLGQTMNRMLDRLERAQTRQRQFVADASHELRSPIAAIRQHAEVALAHPDRTDALARTALAESLRMQALVDDLLVLALADEHALALRRTDVDLDDIVLAESQRLRASTTLAVDATGVSSARVDGDPDALRRLLRNLVDNAVRQARHRLGLSVAERDGYAVLHVDDDGPGVPAEHRARVFQRFVRLDHARARTDGGNGLGLAIVAEIVAAHGGVAMVEDGPLGGARVTVRLPLPG
jgi:signal transduction histidine kinase